MKCLKTGWKCVCRDFHRIHLVDRCLIVFMALLLIQSAYSLVTRSGGIGQSNEIDVIVRTSAASIFGYFLSGSFRSCGQEPRRAIRHKLTSADLTADSKAERADAAECCCPRNWGQAGSDPAEEGAVPAPVCGLLCGTVSDCDGSEREKGAAGSNHQDQ